MLDRRGCCCATVARLGSTSSFGLTAEPRKAHTALGWSSCAVNMRRKSKPELPLYVRRLSFLSYLCRSKPGPIHSGHDVTILSASATLKPTELLLKCRALINFPTVWLVLISAVDV